VAEDVIEAFQVDPGRVSAGVIVLAVDGNWSCRPGPGILVCSQETYEDLGRFGPVLRDAFISGL
jgi:hypothetical protein